MKKLITLLSIAIASMQYSTAQEIGKITKSGCFLEACSLLDNGANSYLDISRCPQIIPIPTRKSYQIAFVVIKARNNSSKPVPILKFIGGRGHTAISCVEFYSQHKLTEDRDMILYDYRGLGYSKPGLSKIKTCV